MNAAESLSPSPNFESYRAPSSRAKARDLGGRAVRRCPARKRTGLALLAAFLAPSWSFAQDAKPTSPWKPIVDFRLRAESFDTPIANAVTQDDSYGFVTSRLRVGFDWQKERWTVHGLLEGASGTGFPVSAVLGSGPTYFAASGRRENVSGAGIAELSVHYKGDAGWARLGRQGYGDGFEAKTGSAFLDGVKRRRLAERLVGNLDFTNVGRRYDGASGQLAWGGEKNKVRLDGYLLSPLSGAFDHDNVFEPLEDITLVGTTLTAERGAWIPQTEARLFAIQYRDERLVAQRIQRDSKLEVTTVGASILAGNDAMDLLVWVAAQKRPGSGGGTDSAFLVDLGKSFPAAAWKPAVHLAFEQASGGKRTQDHQGFFNLIPTNHKFYGSLDYFAFSNLRDVYLESTLTPAKGWKVRAALHDFSLVDAQDAWYGGSGAFQDDTFGYVARRPGPARAFRHRDLGREFDLDITMTVREGLDISWGGAALDAGKAVREVFPKGSDGRWYYFEVSWKP